jgi:hypothetical protein
MLAMQHGYSNTRGSPAVPTSPKHSAISPTFSSCAAAPRRGWRPLQDAPCFDLADIHSFRRGVSRVDGLLALRWDFTISSPFNLAAGIATPAAEFFARSTSAGLGGHLSVD